MTNPPRVLIVDDKKMFRDAIADMFSQSGYQTITAVDGEEGLGLAISEHPDLIFTDYSMPRMNGLEMLIKLREQAGLPKVMMHSFELETSPLAKNAMIQIPELKYVVKGSSPEYIIRIANKLTEYSIDDWIERHG